MEEPREDAIEATASPASVRRTSTMRNNAARQAAVNFMPSRQLPHSTLRLRRNNSEHNALLDEGTDPDAPPGPAGPDGPDGPADRIVHEMERDNRLMDDNPVSEELRREALRELPQGLTMKRHVRAKLSASVSLRSRRRPISFWRRIKYRASFAWKTSQDRFRDFVFSIELWYEAIRHLEGQFGSAVGSYFHTLRALFLANTALAVLTSAFILAPQALHDAGGNATGGEGGKGALQLIAGTGWYADSLLFFGHYHAGATRPPLPYHMPFAYFFTMACLYFAIFALLCYRTAYSYRRNFIETAGGLSHVFASKVFCGWDFGIVSPQAAALNATTLYNEFKELLHEQNASKDLVGGCARLGRLLVNLLVNVLVVAVLAALAAAVWQLLQHWELLVSFCVTIALAVLPLLFNQIVRLEYYSPRTALYVTLVRTWLLEVGTLMVIYYYWTQAKRECWETSFGQEAYRLVLLDCVVSLFLLPLIEVARYFIYKCHPGSSPPEFSLAYNSLTLMYNQTLVWLGLVFSPVLALCVALKLLLLFHVKRQCALRVCLPAGKIWRAAQTQTVLYMLVTLSLFTAMFGLGSLFLRMPSKECGPFRGYDAVYQVWTEGVLNLSNHQTLDTILTFVTRPGVIAFLILFLGVAVYYMRARARAQRSMAALLRHMLVLQAKDKDFLLAAIDRVSSGEWLYSPKPEEAPHGHTWKYLNEVRKPSNAGFQLDTSHARPASHYRPASHHDRPASHYRPASHHDAGGRSDGETDSSFSWKGSNTFLDKDVEDGAKKMY